MFPILNLMSSPSKSVKGVATDLLVLLEKLLVKLLAAPKIEVAMNVGNPCIIGFGSIVSRLLKNLWFQVYSYKLKSERFSLFTLINR